jgi:hypothetical protein
LTNDTTLLFDMFEVTFSIFAWLGVVLVQAMVHFSLGARKRQEELESDPLEGALLVEEHPIFPNGTRPVLVKEPSESSLLSSSLSTHDDEVYHVQELQCKEKQVIFTTRSHSYEGDDEEESLDGDEPQLFFQLLSQTGSEMMNVSTGRVLALRCCIYRNILFLTNLIFWPFPSQTSRSIETLVQEQIQVNG